jgi:hypothetical protein
MELLVLGFTEWLSQSIHETHKAMECCRGGHFPTMVKGTMQFLTLLQGLIPRYTYGFLNEGLKHETLTFTMVG